MVMSGEYDKKKKRKDRKYRVERGNVFQVLKASSYHTEQCSLLAIIHNRATTTYWTKIC